MVVIYGFFVFLSFCITTRKLEALKKKKVNCRETLHTHLFKICQYFSGTTVGLNSCKTIDLLLLINFGFNLF